MRFKLLAGSRLVAGALPDDAELLVAHEELDPLHDVRAAVAEALRYPLSGEPLSRLVKRRGRATIVVSPPLLPLPGALEDPRREALATILDELEALGVTQDDQTILVAGGLERRAGRDELEWLLPPARARDFRGALVVHDCEADDLVSLDDVVAAVAVKVNPAVVETDVVVCVSAAETVLHGGPATLAAACGPAVARALDAESLLEPRSAPGWDLATAVEESVAAKVPLIGVSLVLDLPNPLELARPLTHVLLRLLPEASRRRMLDRRTRELRAVAVMAGPPSVAHAEALLRGTSLRALEIDEPFDTLVVPIPWQDVHIPREAPNPVTVAAVGLGLAMRLWRDRPALAPDGTIVLLHPFSRTIGHGPQAPFRAVLSALRDDPHGRGLVKAEALAIRDRRAIAAYRAGKAPHPRLPFADWESCAPALANAGRVIVAGCRDASTARSLGLVPSHNLTTAVEMGRGVAGGGSLGVLVAPPYVPLVAPTSRAPGRPSVRARSS